ncbi:MAG: nitrilase-related carbon-nitrogen hydrolase [Bacillota bacterium]
MKIAERLKAAGIHMVLGRLYNSKRYEAYVKQLGDWEDHLPGKKAVFKKITAAALQVQLKLHKTTREYFHHMQYLTEEAVKKGAQLIAFPENIHLPLIGVIPFVEKQLSTEQASSNKSTGKDMRELLYLLGPYLEKIYRLTFSTLAKKYKVYIMAGSIITPVGDKLYNMAYFFDSVGQCIGKQKKLHLTPLEEALGLDVGDELTVISLPFARVAFPICMDATYYETFYLARQKGAEIVIVPIANPEEYDFFKAFRGTWPRVQEARVFGIKPALVGRLGNLLFTGKAAIFAPIEITPQRDGIISEAQTYNQEETVLGEIDLAALRALHQDDLLLSDKNQELYDRYLPLLYKGART